MNRVKTSNIKKTLVAWVLLLVTVLSFALGGVTAFAEGGGAYNKLKEHCRNGEYPAGYGTTGQSLVEKDYTRQGGGYWLYTEITGVSGDVLGKEIINEEKYNELTAGQRQEFLKDFISVAYAWEQFTSEQKGPVGSDNKFTGETVTSLMNELQQVSGAGSQIMAALMEDVKPDYATANRILKPFSGITGTILGILAIATMIGVGFTMANDIAYIEVPMYQVMLDGGDDGGQGKKGLAKIISVAARGAVQAADSGGGASGQSGNNKQAISLYFKARWKGLLVLGICLLYLVGGHIWSFVAWIIDLVSGFLGF